MQCLKRPNINAKETGNGPLLKNGWCDQRPHKKPWKRTLSIKSSSTVATTFWRIFPRKYKRKFVNCSSVSVSRWGYYLFTIYLAISHNENASKCIKNVQIGFNSLSNNNQILKQLPKTFKMLPSWWIFAKSVLTDCSSVSVSRWRLIWSLFIWPFRLKVCKIGSIFCKIVVIMSSKNCQSGVHFCQIWSHWRHPPKIRNCKKLEEIPHKK